MIHKGIGVVVALSLLSASTYAGSAPKELYGKSISVVWSEAIAQRPDSQQWTRHIGESYNMSIYISTEGRPFVRLVQANIGSSPDRAGGHRPELSETAPGGSSGPKDRIGFRRAFYCGVQGV